MARIGARSWRSFRRSNLHRQQQLYAAVETLEPRRLLSAAFQLAITASPASPETAGATFSVTVQVQDQLGNLISSETGRSITLTGATFSTGTVTGTDTNGSITFTGLSIDAAGMDNLSATSGSLVSAAPAALTVNPGVPAALAIINPPAAELTRATFSLTAQVQDQFGNEVTTNSGRGVTLAGVTFNTGTFKGNDSGGAITFSGLTINTAGDYTITATSSGLTTSPPADIVIDQAPLITSGSSSTFTSGTAGSVTVTTTGFPTPILTETGILPSGVSFLDNGNGTATLSGTPVGGSGGQYAITINANNGVAPAASQTFHLTVDDAAAFASGANPTLSAGVNGSFNIVFTGFPLPVFNSFGVLPQHLSLVNNSNGTATLGGIPVLGSFGVYRLTLTATNAGGSATQNLTLTINQAPAITSASSLGLSPGTAASFNVTTTGSPTSALTELGSLPAGMSFVDNGNGTATIAGTPTQDGAYPLTITATNGVTPAAVQSFTLTVGAAPAITSASFINFSELLLGSFTVTTNGFPFPALTKVGPLPVGVSFVDNGDGTAVLAGTPLNTGTFNFTIKAAANGVGPAVVQAFTLSVTLSEPAAHGGFPVAPVVSSTPLSNQPALIATGDLGSNGEQSVVLASNGELDIFKYVNGTLQLVPSQTRGPSQLSGINAPTQLLVADVTGDGIPDIILAGGVGATGYDVVVVLPGNGDGTFGNVSSTFGIFNTTPITGLAVGNFNGHPDLAISYYNSRSVTINLGDGMGGFPSSESVDVGFAPTQLATANFNGTAGLIVGNNSAGQIGVLVGNGNGTFKPETYIASGKTSPLNSLVVADVNGDGNADIIESVGNSFSVLLGNGDGTFKAAKLTTTTAIHSLLAVADVTGDGNLDLVTANATQVQVLPGNGDGTFGPAEIVSVNPGTSYQTYALGAADFAGDGTAGIVAASQANLTLTTMAANGAQAREDLGVGNTPKSVALGDFNKDGYTDLVVSNYNSSNVELLEGDGTGNFSSPRVILSGAHFGVLQAGDLNGDGASDVVAAVPASGTIEVLLSNNAAGFFPVQTINLTGTNPNPEAIALAPLTTSGGLPYIFVADEGTDQISIIKNNGGVLHNYGATLAINGSPDSIVTGDFNGDGFTDLAVGTLTGQIYIFLGDGTGNFQAAPYGPLTFSSLQSLAVADIKGDGKLDLVAQSPNAVGEFLGNGDGTFSYSPVLNASASMRTILGMAVTDTNGDGRPDIVLNYSGGPSSVVGGVLALLGNGDGTFLNSGAIPDGELFTGGPAFVAGPLTTSNANNPALFGTGVGVVTELFNAFPATLTAPAFISSNQASFKVDSPGSFTVISTGTGVPSLSTTGALPTGLTFTANNNGTGTISGIPTGTATDYFITINAMNGNGPTITQTLTIALDQAPRLTSSSVLVFNTGTAGTFQITTSGFPAPAITGTGVDGLILVDNGNGTATVSGTPTPGTSGQFLIPVTISNGIAPNLITAIVVDVDQAPMFTSGTNQTFYVGTAGTFTISTSGFPIPTLVKLGGVPTGMTYTNNNNGTATISGIPALNQYGEFDISLSASNLAGSVAQILTLTVFQAPVITSTSHPIFVQGTAGSFIITTSASPTATVSEVGSLPAGLSFHANGNGTATISGTALADGNFPLTINATSSVSPAASQTITIAVDQAPVITSASSAGFVDGSANSFQITTAAFPTAVTTEAGLLPGGVSFVDNGNGTATLSGTPVITGVYNFTLTAANGSGKTATQNFTLTVEQLPAITSSNSAVFTAGGAGTFTVTTSGSPTSAVSESGSLPAGLSFIDNGDGTATIAGTPAAGSGGLYQLAISANNGLPTSTTQAFTLTVNQATSITSSNQFTLTAGIAANFTVTTSGFPVATITQIGTLPAGLSFADNGDSTATISGIATVGGIFKFSIFANDGIGSFAAKVETVTIDQAPSITSAAAITFHTGTAASFTISTGGFPAAAISEDGELPAGITFTDHGNGTATLSGTAAANTGGTYPLGFDAGNGVGEDATQAFVLTVDTTPVFTSAGSVYFLPATAASFNVITTGFPTAALTESGALPNGVSFLDNGDGTATLAGSAPAGSQGIYPITFTAVSDGVTATQVFTLTVGAPGATPPQVVLDGTALVGVGSSTADIASITFSSGSVTIKVDTAILTVSTKSITEIDVTLLGGNDFLTIGPGVPAVNAFGGVGNDTIIAANAFDTLGGGAGPDSLVAGTGNNILDGGNGADTLVAGSGNDTLTGDNGIDSLVGGPGNDLLKGGLGADTLVAGTGHNTLNGNTGNDMLYGGGGFAVLNGGPGNDTLFVGAGDTPMAGGGNPLILT